VAGPCLIDVKQPVSELDEGLQLLDRADTAPRIDPPQEQHFRSVEGPNTG
jgi:hypothetical protein